MKSLGRKSSTKVIREAFCFSQDANIRIDTHRDNRIMQHNIEKYGFTYCGIIYLANGDERFAYQRLKDEYDTM